MLKETDFQKTKLVRIMTNLKPTFAIAIVQGEIKLLQVSSQLDVWPDISRTEYKFERKLDVWYLLK